MEEYILTPKKTIAPPFELNGRSLITLYSFDPKEKLIRLHNTFLLNMHYDATFYYICFMQQILFSSKKNVMQLKIGIVPDFKLKCCQLLSISVHVRGSSFHCETS